MASAWRFGGPLLRLGRSNVHGISRAAQALHGGPDSSHYEGASVPVSTQLSSTFRVGGRKVAREGARMELLHTFTFRILHESHALRNLFGFELCASAAP
jgi:hypothetical protein